MKKFTKEEAIRAFQTLGEILEEVYGVSKGDLLADNTIKIPAGIFQSELSPFSSIATYLNQQGHDSKKIAKILKRNKTFVSNSIQDTEIEESGILIPVTIFSGKLSILEAAVDYLAKAGLDNSEIAEELGRSTSAVWTLRKRAQRKRKDESE